MQKSKPAGLKLRSGIWHIDKIIRVGDRKRAIRETTGFKKEEIEAAASRLKERIAEVNKELTEPPKPKEHSFAEAAAEYIISLERRGKGTERQLYALKSIMDTIGDMPLSHIHQGTLNGWVDEQYGKLKGGSVAKVLTVVTTVLNHAARVLRDGPDPWLKIAVPKLEAPDWNDRRRPVQLTWEEQDKLVAELPSHLVPPVLFGVYTGARQEEVASLSWEQECQVTGMPRGSVWWIPPEIRKKNAKKALSEQEGRYLICNRIARSVIDGQRENGSEWVFPTTHRGRTERINNSGWRHARDRAGLNIRLHDLRHTFGARAAAAGIPWDHRKVLLGHNLRDITGHYSAPGLLRLLEEAEKITREGAVVLKPVTQSSHSGKLKVA
jgi:integrase